jgi:hypothetical protein
MESNRVAENTLWIDSIAYDNAAVMFASLPSRELLSQV